MFRDFVVVGAHVIIAFFTCQALRHADINAKHKTQTQLQVSRSGDVLSTFSGDRKNRSGVFVSTFTGSRFCDDLFNNLRNNIQRRDETIIHATPGGPMDFQGGDSGNLHDLWRRRLSDDAIAGLFRRGYLANVKYQVLERPDIVQRTKNLVSELHPPYHDDSTTLQIEMFNHMAHYYNFQPLAVVYLKCKVALEIQGHHEERFRRSFQRGPPSGWRKLGYDQHRIPLAPEHAVRLLNALNAADFAVKALVNAAVCVLEGGLLTSSPLAAQAYGKVFEASQTEYPTTTTFGPERDPQVAMSIYDDLVQKIFGSRLHWTRFEPP